MCPQKRTYMLGALAMAVLAWPCLGSASHMTGVSGTVRVSPARPGPQRAGEPDSAPYQGMTVQVRDTQGNVVAHATTDAQGQFTAAVPAGNYEIHVGVQHAPWPRCETVEATVRADEIAHVEILCDSGLR